MDYVPLGNTGLYVSRLCFGAMTFGDPDDPSHARVGNEGQETANTMVETALDAGINFFDTANGYGGGTSEVMLGKALGKKRHDAIVATKLYFPMGSDVNQLGSSRLSVMREVEDSLKRLGTDYIDLYQVHSWDESTPIQETMRALDDCVRQGKVRYIGLSNFTAWQIAHANGVAELLGTEKFCSIQAYYSLVGRELEWDILPAARHLGLGTMIWSPLSAGFLTGKYSGKDAAEGRRSIMSFPPIDTDQGDRVVDVLKEIGSAHGVSPSQVALSWLLHQDGVTSIIVGARKLYQLEDNLGAINVKLSADELSRLNDVSAIAPKYPHFMPKLQRGADLVAAIKHAEEVAKKNEEEN